MAGLIVAFTSGISVLSDRRELLLLSEKRIAVSSCLLLCSSAVEMYIYETCVVAPDWREMEAAEG